MQELHGFYLEDLAPGMTALYAKTVTDADVVLFAGISGDVNPVHLNQEFADQIQVGQAALITDSETLKGTIRGKVKRISDWFAQRRSPLFEPRQLNDVRTLECIIEIDPAQAKDLRIGQRVRVKIEKK